MRPEKTKKFFLKKIPVARLAVFLVIMVIVLLVLVFFLFRGTKNLSINKNKTNGPVGALCGEQLNQNVFGDHFSNDLLINKEKTTFYYDVITTAFTFSPLYKYTETNFCSDAYCDASSSDLFFPGLVKNPVLDDGRNLGSRSFLVDSELTVQKYCLDNSCLETKGNTLLYQGKKITAPIVLKETEILNITIYPLSRNWLVGYVVRQEGKEFGRAFRFDGKKFSDLDLENIIPLTSRPGFEGAYFGFGGDDNNFLVLYGGYDILGYQVVSNKLIDLKSFFGLRTSGGGFAPLAFKQERNNETLWYICSRLSGRPRFIKLWQNGSESIKGILSFSDKFFEKNKNISSAWCQAGKNPGEMEIFTSQNGTYKRQIFYDQGFDQTHDYSLISANIFKDKGLIKQARFNGLLACGKNNCGASAIDNSLRFLAGTTQENVEPISLGSEFVFKKSAPGLYWEIFAAPRLEKIDYSPWIDGLIDISYAWKK